MNQYDAEVEKFRIYTEEKTNQIITMINAKTVLSIIFLVAGIVILYFEQMSNWYATVLMIVSIIIGFSNLDKMLEEGEEDE